MTPDSWQRLEATFAIDLAWARLVNTQLETLSRENQRLWESVEEIRDSIINLDHRHADLHRAHAATREVLHALQEGVEADAKAR